MIFERRVAMRLATAITTCVIFVASTAAAQPGPANSSLDAGAAPADRVRISIAAELVNRTFDLTGPTDVLLDAPFYPGARLTVELFPIALFARDSAAAPLGFVLQTSKHALNTVAAVALDEDTYDLDVPTRHDVSYYGLQYEWEAADRVTFAPAIGWRTVEFSLGYNPLYRNSFYRGVEFGATVGYALSVEGLGLRGGLALRPAVDLGSTVEPFGKTSSSLGFAVNTGMRYRSSLGLFGDAAFGYERYGTTYRPDRSEDRDDSRSVDSFQSFVFTLGYAY